MSNFKLVLHIISNKDDRKDFFREFSWNIGIGLFVFFIFSIIGSSLLMDVEDEYMDLMMDIRVDANKIPPVKKKEHSFVFLDIDNETFQDWGEPLFTPRNRLESLINTAIKAKSSLVVVDVDISQNTPIETSEIHPVDEDLRDYLDNYVKKCRKEKDQSKCPPIIFVRAFSSPLDNKQIMLKPRTGFLEQIVTQGFPYLQWGSAQFYLSEDLVIRRWKLWQETCVDEKPQISPSIQLLAMSIAKENCSIEKIQTALEKFKPQSCDSDNIATPKIMEVCGITLSDRVRDHNQRIMYSMAWEDKKVMSDKVLLNTFSAKPYSDNSSVSLDELKDRIVVIGGSYNDGRDIHLTPIGYMPGALIIINSIHSMVNYQKTEYAYDSWWLSDITISVVLIIILSFLLASICAVFGSAIGIIFIFSSMVYIVVELNSGFWLTPISSLVAVEVTHTLRELFKECLVND